MMVLETPRRGYFGLFPHTLGLWSNRVFKIRPRGGAISPPLTLFTSLINDPRPCSTDRSCLVHEARETHPRRQRSFKDLAGRARPSLSSSVSNVGITERYIDTSYAPCFPFKHLCAPKPTCGCSLTPPLSSGGGSRPRGTKYPALSQKNRMCLHVRLETTKMPVASSSWEFPPLSLGLYCSRLT